MSLLNTVHDLRRRRARERHNLALAEGVRMVEEMVAAQVACKGVAIAPALEKTSRGRELVGSLELHGIAIVRVSDHELTAAAATEHPQGIVAVYQPKRWTTDDFHPAAGRPLVLLDAIQDPGNVGTIARTAAAFEAAGLIALQGTVDLTNPKVVRASAGALFRLPHLHADTDTIVKWLWTHSIPIWVATMDGGAIGSDDLDRAVALVLGNEGAGISTELLSAAERRIGVPMAGGAESLNVSVAAGILLHQLRVSQ